MRFILMREGDILNSWTEDCNGSAVAVLFSVDGSDRDYIPYLTVWSAAGKQHTNPLPMYVKRDRRQILAVYHLKWMVEFEVLIHVSASAEDARLALREAAKELDRLKDEAGE